MGSTRAVKDLNKQQRSFAIEYIKDNNATLAAERAGYSKRSAHIHGCRLLKNDKVRQAIDELCQRIEERAIVTVEDVLSEYLKIAKTDIADAFDESGHLKPIHDIPVDCRRAISSIEVEELFEGFGREREQIGVTKKIKFWEKTKALDALGRYLKMFTDNIDVNINLGIAERLKRSRERSDE